jgi:hypothetical protein
MYAAWVHGLDGDAVLAEWNQRLGALFVPANRVVPFLLRLDQMQLGKRRYSSEVAVLMDMMNLRLNSGQSRFFPSEASL